LNAEKIEVSCKEAARLMSHRQDRTLSEDETVALKNHLFACLSCRNFSEQLGFLGRLARRYGGEGPPPEGAPT
jgi:predicted anti-sigma-YlaC factor YlaD